MATSEAASEGCVDTGVEGRVGTWSPGHLVTCVHISFSEMLVATRSRGPVENVLTDDEFAIAFDEDPLEAAPIRNSDDGASRRMMEMLEDNAEAIGSKLYVDLANLCGNFAQLERQSARMRAKLIDYDGESCSALVPSDAADFPEDYESASEEEHEDSDGDCDDDDAYEIRSYASTRESQIVPSDFDSESENGLGANHVESIPRGPPLGASPFHMKSRGKYYSIPKEAFKRKANCVQVANIGDLTNMTMHGGRTKFYDQYILDGKINERNIFVLEMKNRGGTKEFYWACTLNLAGHVSGLHIAADKIVNLMPEAAVFQLYTKMNEDPILKRSRLCSTWKPNFLNLPAAIPGPTRIFKPAASAMPRVEIGNGWVSMGTSMSLVAPAQPVKRKRRILDDDDEDD